MPRAMHVLDVPLDERDTGRTLRVGVSYRDGVADELVLAMGYGRGAAWREVRGAGLELPASVAPGVLDAIQRLLRAPAAPTRAGDCPHPGVDLVYEGLFASTFGPDRVHVFRCPRCDSRFACSAPPAGHAELVGREPDAVTVLMPSSPRVSCTLR